MSVPTTSTQMWFQASIVALFTLLIFSPPVVGLIDAVLAFLCLPRYCTPKGCLSLFGLVVNVLAVLFFVRYAPLV